MAMTYLYFSMASSYLPYSWNKTPKLQYSWQSLGLIFIPYENTFIASSSLPYYLNNFPK